MKKTYTFPLTLLVLGVVITIIGAIFKLMYWPGAKIMMLFGMLAEVIGLIVLIYRMLKKK